MSLEMIALPFLVGIATGAIHYRSLWWNVQQLTTGGSTAKVLTIQLLRLGFVSGVMVATARFGALPLLVAALGVLTARVFAVRLVRAAP
jgi:F1F0 ATPase subunit 2